MYFYLTLTLNCNLYCKYCYEKCVNDIGKPFPFDVDDSLPSHITYGMDTLANFISMDPEPVIIFYGGEPLLAVEKMREIMDSINVKAYIIQTNGLLIDKIEPKYITQFKTILVSLDGDEQLTDSYRGKGVYRKVVENLKLLKSMSFKGEIIARMTVNPETDLYQAVNWLLFNKEFPFESVHWQLDAQFWQFDYRKEYIQKWFERYNRDIRRLVSDWVTYMETTGKVLRIYPFIGIAESLLKREATKLRCGAGWIEFNIQTDGNITPCPVMAGMKAFYLGNISTTNPKSLVDAMLIKEQCPQCSIYVLCGGRCLYANATKLWGDEGFRLVCETIKNLIDSLEEAQRRITKAISNKKIALSDFNYPKYNSCEIIP